MGGSAGVRALDALPGRTVPMLDQGLARSALGAESDRPGVTGRGGSHAFKDVAASAQVKTLDYLPGRAVPVHGQGTVECAAGVLAYSPGIVRGSRGDAGERTIACRSTRIRALDHFPRCAVPVLHQSLDSGAADVRSDRPCVTC